MKRFLSAFISATFLYAILIPPFLHAQSDRVFLAVLDLDVSSGIPDYAKVSLSDLLREQLWKTGRFRVVDRNNMERIMKEQGFQLADCTSKECAVQVGRLLGVQKMVTGNISMLGKTYILSAQMTDVETGEIVRMASDRCSGCELDQLLTSIDEVAKEMAGVAAGEVAPPKITGGIQVRSIPTGAAVTLNGKQMGNTPALIEQLRPGMYQVEVAKDRYLAFQKRVEVKDTMVEVEAKLDLDPTQIAPVLGSLDITTEPAGARVFLDGEPVGTTPTLLENVDPGVHRLSFTKWGYVATETAVKVGTEKMPVKVTLKRLATLKITGDPPGARISLDGSFLGQTPQETTVSPGEHKIEITKQGYVTYRDEFEVKAEDTKTIEYKLLMVEGAVLEAKPPKKKSTGKTAKGFYYTGVAMALLGGISGSALSISAGMREEHLDEDDSGMKTGSYISYGVGGAGFATMLLSYILMPPQTGRQRAHLFGFTGVDIALTGAVLALQMSLIGAGTRSEYEEETDPDWILLHRDRIENWNSWLYISYGIVGAGALMSLISFIAAPAEKPLVTEIPVGKGFSIAPEMTVLPDGGTLRARVGF